MEAGAQSGQQQDSGPSPDDSAGSRQRDRLVLHAVELEGEGGTKV